MKLLCFFSVAVLLFACNKTDIKKNQLVQARIKNSTTSTLQNATAGGASYGNIQPGAETVYKIIATPIYAGYCAYSINGVESCTFNGICGTPMPPPFDADFYTFTIEPANGGYNMLTVTKQ
jgi:hypothetical protein